MRARLAALACVMIPTAAMADAVEADLFQCVSEAFEAGSETGASSALIVGGSLATARGVWFVRAPSVRADGKPAPWCPDALFLEPRSGTCRTDGPPLPSGPLTLQVTETLRGPKTSSVEVRMGETSRGAFVEGAAEADAASACEQGGVLEDIAGQGYFSPYVAALHPKREFALIVSRQEDDRTIALAVVLPEEPGEAKRMLRRLVRRR